jgi:hypothetical protein
MVLVPTCGTGRAQAVAETMRAAHLPRNRSRKNREKDAGVSYRHGDQLGLIYIKRDKQTGMMPL